MTGEKTDVKKKKNNRTNALLFARTKMSKYGDISLPDIEEGLPFMTEETATTKTGLLLRRIKRQLKTKDFWIKAAKLVVKLTVVIICAVIFNWGKFQICKS